MKNLMKFFVAVAVVMGAFACTTDTTEDLGIVPVGKTTVNVSLEASRTQLGDKDAEGKYPLYWNAGDAIAVNGVASQPLAENFDGLASASFSFNGEVAHPYNAVYPAPAEGVTAAEGLFPVTFLAEQAYTAGTFVAGAAPMYGYAEGDELQLNHLAGVLRFAIKGEHTLSNIVITAEAPIAGNFDVNCQTGELTAHADASNTVTVTFGEGLALGAEATPIYVAVPAGEHGLYTIVITSTEGESMVVKFNSESKPVKVGVVKEFGEFLFVPAVATAPQGELIITNESDMKQLSTWAENGMLTEVTSVKVAGNIDMSKIAGWAPIVNFPAITFDGGSAEGYAISGLTAPLFESVDGATIKNVKLTGVNITETARLHFGALVCDAVNATISNCSAEGAVTYACETAIVGATNSSHAVAGMVGNLKGASTLTGSTNAVNVTITKYAASCDKKVYNPFGALVGSAQGTSAKNVVISNCTNLGYVLSKVKSITNVQPAIGAVAGLSHFVTLNNITNGKEGDTTCGNVTFEQAQSCVGAAAAIGAAKNVNIDGITNYGSFTYKQSIAYPYVGGVIGTWWGNDGKVGSTITNITNYGDVNIAKMSNKAGTPYIGGILGRNSGSSDTVLTMKDCTNHGDVNVLASFALTTQNFLLGGIVGGGDYVVFDNCDNYGTVTLDGTLNSEFTDTTTTVLYAGGIAGQISGSGSFTLCDNHGALNLNTKVLQGHIGGVVGAAKPSSFTKNHNHGDITVSGEILKNTGFCGLGSSLTVATDQCSNSGDITVSATQPSSSAGAYYIVALAWTSSYNHTNFTNSGNITFTGMNYKNLFVSGGVYTVSKSYKNLHNSGTLKVKVDGLACTTKIGGLGRSSSGGTLENCSNSGDIIFEGTSKGTVYLGGLAGDNDGATKIAGDKGFVNTGNVKFLGSTTNTVYVGGIVGNASKALASATVLKNEGLVTNYDATTGTIGKTSKDIRFGGCLGSASGEAQGVAMVNTGDVYVRNAEGGIGATAFVGGVVGNTVVTISKAKADCDVAAIDFVEVSGKVGVGMITGAHRSTTTPLVDACKVGGRYALAEKNGQPDWITISPELFQEEDAGGDVVVIPGFAPFWKKIYGGTGDETTVDGCTYESANPAVAPVAL